MILIYYASRAEKSILDPIKAELDHRDIDNLYIDLSQCVKNIDNDKNIIFLSGGILTDYGINVAGAGDIVKSNALKELISVFEKVDSNTIIVIVEKNNE